MDGKISLRYLIGRKDLYFRSSVPVLSAMGRCSLKTMFNMAITSIQDAVTQLKNVKDGQEFSNLLANLRNFLKTLDVKPQSLMELEQRAYYLVNEYSDKETRDNLDAARKQVIE